MTLCIGIPTYKRPQDLVNCVNYLLSNGDAINEIIICDNGGSWSPQLEKIITKNNHKIRYIRNEKNIGIIHNTIKCLKLCESKFFAWMSDDDWRSKNYYKLCLEKYSEYESDDVFICSNVVEINENFRKNRPYRQNLSKNWKYFSSPFVLIRLVSFFMQSQTMGKCNLFYSVFKTKDLLELSLESIGENGKNLQFDNFLIYSVLRKSRLILLQGDHIALKEDNVKHYRSDSSYSFYQKIITYLIGLVRYFKNTRSKLVLTILLFILPLKIAIELYTRVKIRTNRLLCFLDKNWLAYRAIFDDNLKIDLMGVCLVCVATKNVTASCDALNYSKSRINFGETLLISNYEPYNISDNVFHQIDAFESVEDWGEFILFELHKYIGDFSHILLIHDDGFIVNPDSWDYSFLKYDYVGAPWPEPSDKVSFRTLSGEIVRVGNSVSLRSKRILELPDKLKLKFEAFHGFKHEDGFLCVQHRDELITNGMVFGDIEAASRFGRENFDGGEEKPFTFHKWRRKNKQFPNFNKC